MQPDVTGQENIRHFKLKYKANLKPSFFSRNLHENESSLAEVQFVINSCCLV